MITISAFNWVPDFARGLVPDLRVLRRCTARPAFQRTLEEQLKDFRSAA